MAVAGVIGVEAAPASAATSTFTAVADTQIREASPALNYGTSTALRVDGGGDPDVQSFLGFSVTGLSGAVQSATLRVYATSTTANGPSVFTPAATWAESTLTWSNRPALVGAGVGKVTTIAASSWAAFDVTSLVTGTGTFDLVLAGTSTDGVNFQSREATHKPVLVITTTTSGDTAPPSVPGTLTASASSATRVGLQWGASTDDVGVSGYEIFRDSVLLTTVGAVTSFADTTVSASTAYAYQVRAFDAAGHRSGFSNTATVSTPAATAITTTFTPTADAKVDEATPTTNYATTALRVDYGTAARVESDLMFAVSGTSGTVRAATLRLWATSGTIDGPAVYPTTTGWSETGITWGSRPALTGSAVADVAGVSTGTWVDVDVTRLITGNGTFAVTLAGVSTDGVDFTSREGTNKPQLVVTTGAADTQAPQPPSGLIATSGSPYQVDLSWNAAVDDVAVTSYIVLRGGTQLAVVDASQRTYSDTTVTPNTSYTYTVKARDAAGNTSAGSSKTVTTPTASSTAPVIAAAGDIACATSDANYDGGTGTSSACRQLYTSNLLVNGGFAAVLPLGDEQYNSGALSEFNAVYDPTWGRVKPISRPVVGNHEYGQSGASGYFTYYGSLAGDPSKGYYSFDIGSWHIVALNSNCTKVAGGCDAGSPQETWLRADLSAHPALCTLAMSHHARWSSGHDGDNVFMQAMWQDLFDAGVEVLLSGHSHDYERYAPQNGSGGLDSTSGVRQFVVGTGGAFFTGFGTTDANSQVRNNTTFGILKMTLRSTGYDWQFMPEAGKTFTDSGTTSCQ